MDKFFGIYSLLFPLFLIGLFQVVFKFGRIEADTVSRPFAVFSDLINLFVICIIIILFIKNVNLCKEASAYSNKVMNIMITTANGVLSLQVFLTIQTIWAAIFTFLLVEPIYIIIWIAYLVYFIIYCVRG